MTRCQALLLALFVVFFLNIALNLLIFLFGPVQLAVLSYEFRISNSITGEPLPNAAFYWEDYRSKRDITFFNEQINYGQGREDTGMVKIGASGNDGVIKFQTRGPINDLDWYFPEIGNLDLSYKVLYITNPNCKTLVVRFSDIFPNLAYHTRLLKANFKMQCK